MTDAQLIDGKAIAADVRATVARQVSALKKAHGMTPGLAVVLVGEDPASQIYVRNKGKQTIAAGMQSFEFKLPTDTTQDDLMAKVAALNANPEVHGILVQMPLPAHLDENAVVNAIDPDKDVDGLHPVNAGRLSLGEDGLVPCTPTGCMILLDRAGCARRRRQRGGNRTLEVGRQADGAVVVGCQRHGDDGAFTHARPRRGVPRR